MRGSFLQFGAGITEVKDGFFATSGGGADQRGPPSRIGLVFLAEDLDDQRSTMSRRLVENAARDAQALWSNLVEEKPLLPFLVPLCLLAWFIERWIIPLSNWVPFCFIVWATLEVCSSAPPPA